MQPPLLILFPSACNTGFQGPGSAHTGLCSSLDPGHSHFISFDGLHLLVFALILLRQGQSTEKRRAEVWKRGVPGVWSRSFSIAALSCKTSSVRSSFQLLTFWSS